MRQTKTTSMRVAACIAAACVLPIATTAGISASAVVAVSASDYLHSGDTLLSDGEMAAAAAQYTRAVHAAPKNPFYRLNLGVTLAALGKLNEAAAQFREARSLSEDDVIAALLLGGVYAEQGKAAEAQTIRQETVQRFGRDGGLDAAGSVARLEAAAKEYPRSAIAHLLLGDAYQVSKRWEPATAAYGRAIRLAPRWTKPRVNLGVLYLTQSRPADAIRVFEAALKLSPGDVRLQLYQADAQAEMGNTADALKTYRQVEKQADREPAVAADAMTRSGNILLRNRRHDEAIEYFSNAQKLAPKNPAPVAGQAEALVQSGEYNRAVEAYKSALKLASAGGLLSTRPILYRGLAEAQLSDGKPQAALETLERALREEPRSAPLWHRLRAQALLVRGDRTGGEAALRQALEAEPDRYPLETLNAVAAQDWTASVTAYYTERLSGPERPAAMAILAHLARYAGDIAREEDLRKQVVAARGSGIDLYLLADTYERAGRPADALVAYRDALSRDGLSDTAREWAASRIASLSPRQP